MQHKLLDVLNICTITVAPQSLQACPEALVIDPAVNVALLGFGDGARVPRTGGGELTGPRQAAADTLQACPEAFVIDPAVNVALLGFLDSALVPGTGGVELPDLQ